METTTPDAHTARGKFRRVTRRHVCHRRNVKQRARPMTHRRARLRTLSGTLTKAGAKASHRSRSVSRDLRFQAWMWRGHLNLVPFWHQTPLSLTSASTSAFTRVACLTLLHATPSPPTLLPPPTKICVTSTTKLRCQTGPVVSHQHGLEVNVLHDAVAGGGGGCCGGG